MRRDLADQRDIFVFYLAVISGANSTCKAKTGEDVVESRPKNFFHHVSYVRAMSGLCPSYVYWPATSVFFFPSHRFGVAVKGNPIVLETYPSPRRENFPEVIKLPREKSVKFP